MPNQYIRAALAKSFSNPPSLSHIVYWGCESARWGDGAAKMRIPGRLILADW